MKRLAKHIFTNMVTPVLRAVASIWFDKRYLRGRYFDCSLTGWGWAARGVLLQKFLGFNRHVPWPISPANAVDDPSGVIFHPDDLNNFMHHGCYYSNVGGGKIVIGKGTLIAPNVGIITTNHRIDDVARHDEPRDVIIGERCWIGMNAVILPGVRLGDNTVVAAGAVVSRSCPDGWCVLAGVPARPVRSIARTNDGTESNRHPDAMDG